MIAILCFQNFNSLRVRVFKLNKKVHYFKNTLIRVVVLYFQKTALTYHIETLKREIQSALHDRDKALKECHDLQERFGEFTAKEESQREGYKSRFEYAYSRERLVEINFL